MTNKDKIYKQIVANLKDKGATHISVYGSFARGQEKKDSDIDLLVEFKNRKKTSLLDLVEIENALKEKLGRKVDLQSRKSISPYIIPFIEKDEVTIYSQN